MKKLPEIQLPELPPGYVWGSSIYPCIDSTARERPPGRTTIVGWVRESRAVNKFWAYMCPLTGHDERVVFEGDTVQDCLNVMVAKLWLGEWE